MSKQYNLDYLVSISEGDEEFIKDMVGTFIEDTPAELGKLKELINAKSWTKVGEQAHKFSSSLMFLGLENLKAISYQIEISGLENKNTELIPALLDELEAGCFNIIEELKHDFNV